MSKPSFDLLSQETKQRSPGWLLILIWVVVQLYLLNQFGIVTELEADKYITQARYFLAHGHFEERRYLFYSVQIILMSICVKLGDAWWLGYIVQVLISGYSSWKLYCFLSIRRYAKLPWLITLLWILNIPAQTFNVYLQTESIFISFLLLFLFYLFGYQGGKQRLFHIGLFLVLLCLIRPTGLLVIPATLFYIYVKNKPYWALWKGWAYWSLLLFVTVLLVNFAMDSGGEWNFLLPFETRQIICGVPTTTRERIEISMNPNSLQGIFDIILKHPTLFLELAAKRFISFISMTRSYYSTAHNFFLLVFFVPIWLLSLIHSFKSRKYHYEIITLWMIIAAFAAIAVLTCDDWHNRLTLTAMTAVFLTFAFTNADTTTVETDLGSPES